MMQRAVAFFSSEVRGIHAAAYVLGVSSLLSSLLALLRDRTLAHAFGAGIELDLYYAAFRLPDLAFVAIGALVSAYVLIPELARRTGKEQFQYLDTVLFWFSLLAALVGSVLFLLTPHLLPLLFPQFSANGSMPVLTTMTQILLLQPILLGFSNILAAVTQSRHRYALYAVSPLVYNIGIILGVLVLYPFFGLSGLAWGVVIGAALHVGIQMPSVRRDGFFQIPLRIGSISVFLRTAWVSVPRALALSMSQVAFLGLLVLAGTLTSGSISIFMFAFNLQAVPLAIIGASYSVAAFPTLAAAFTSGEREAFISHISSAARHVLFWSLPAFALVLVLRAHLVRVALGSGAFDWTDTRLTAAALALFAISLAAQGLTLLLVRGYYASGRSMVPLITTGLTAILAVALGAGLLTALHIPRALAFVEVFLRVDGVPGVDVLSLPLSYSLASMVGLIAIVVHFEWRFGGFIALVGRSWWESLTAALVSGFAAYFALIVLGPVTLSSTFVSVLVRGFIAGSTGICAAGLAYSLLGNREYEETILALKRRLWRGVEPVSSAEESPVA